MTTLCRPVPAWITAPTLRQVNVYLKACLDRSKEHAPTTVREYHCDDSIDDNDLGSTLHSVAPCQPIHGIEYP